jgi:hypothetical protein
MAFADTPQIDRYSINSNRSELALEAALNQSSGFICRKDIPDKGCDYDIELITDGTNASNWRFGLQLKSVEKLTLVANNEYVSYSFETSRLGYLMRRPFGAGVIALYSMASDVIYFDYVDRVYNRLMEERDSTDWMQNDSVNVRIPTSSILDTHGISELHKTFSNRFLRGSVLLTSHGDKYGLPTTNITGEVKYDWNNLEDIKKMLREYGLLLLNSYDLTIVYDLISQVSHKEICADPELLKIAAITYCEVGMYAEASLYNKRFIKSEADLRSDSLTMEYVALKIDLGLGKITWTEFSDRAKLVVLRDTSEQNAVTVEINLIFSELAELKINDDASSDLLDRINSIFERIDKSKSITASVKVMLKIWNAENYGIFVDRISYNEITNFKLQEALGVTVSKENRIEYVQRTINRSSNFLAIISKLNEEVEKEQSKLGGAYLRALLSRNFLSKELENIALNITKSEDSHRNLIHNRITLAFDAYNRFVSLNHYREAYTSICDALELMKVSRKYYRYEDSFEESKGLEIKEKMEQEFGFPPYKMVIQNLLEKVKNNAEDHAADYKSLANFTDEQLEWFAKRLQHAMQLAPSCLVNILAELKAYRIFAKRCTNSNIELLQSNETRYLEPVRFVLRTKDTNIQSVESQDVEYLLQQWGM